MREAVIQVQRSSHSLHAPISIDLAVLVYRKVQFQNVWSYCMFLILALYVMVCCPVVHKLQLESGDDLRIGHGFAFWALKILVFFLGHDSLHVILEYVSAHGSLECTLTCCANDHK